MNYYYEIIDADYNRKYYVEFNRLATSGPNFRLLLYAQRVWQEDSQQIIYAKNRTYGPTARVDLEEFMWIKLKAIVRVPQ